MEQVDIEDIEVRLFLEATANRYGYDFRDYARASITRRLRQLAQRTGCQHISEMLPRLLYDDSFFPLLIHALSIGVTEMFRDPPFWLIIRNEIIPLLKTYPSVRIWHAGCSSGEEVYSLAIVLREEGIYDRTTIFATDFNMYALEKARDAIYALNSIREHTINYQQAGGKFSFSEYYHAEYTSAIMERSLRERITFIPHNLAVDQVFGEMHLILCRNVLIYFNPRLQQRVLRLFDESLVNGGFLALGSRERLSVHSLSEHYTVVDRKWRVYKKKSQYHHVLEPLYRERL
ncbi:CheR family methyltransferase [Desulfovibrio inopinatus]|uniref:CheR family methyltransferase n=1 Tax=Desulfovibrio inopinatus TaxID=102109 RepID=UPI00041BB622|nr:CheR family methyltransferase [Desulfovibrio inopinatus]